ncbi:hypothetical protein [Catellatospora citrea]|uniref:Uncharacterized protein n=1 Tax=Catellatospora citrea TaxID=53366 RepID=A0A8J3P3Z7_9ACTN|nr:hypothetical protein [Catellatospora citrea]RKE08359.1 hypothetical protein C8E86_3209 [Catellatospora citrea]GIG03166.1 hypothetical protein Cci01nite_82590 [Catellatospora citrea]
MAGYQGPDDYTRARAQIPDASLAEGIRVAMVAVWWWFDAWWPERRATASKYDRKRAEMIQDARDVVTAKGASANVDELVRIGSPLLGEFWPKSSEPEASLAAAIDGLRDALLFRVQSVHRARDDVARWDGKKVLRTM